MEISAISLGAALAVWLSGFGVALGEGKLAAKSIEMLGKSPRMAKDLLIYTILGAALVESGVIYGLVIAFQMLANSGASDANFVGAGLVIGITGMAIGFWEWNVIASAIEALNRNPDIKNQILQYMVLFVALVETSGIYGLIIAFKLLG